MENDTVKLAYQGFLELEKLKAIDRSQGIQLMAEGLENAYGDILEANTLDLEQSREMAIPELIINWLKLTPKRLDITIDILKKIAQLSDPLERLRNASYQLNYSQTYCQLKPLGVISFIYEGFPELGAIATAMAIKTGNSIVIRSSSEASHSNTVIANVLKNALEQAELPENCLQVILPDDGCSIEELVSQDQYLNLAIPYGRPSLIAQVTKLSTVPVLKSALGNCYLYWSSSGDLELVRRIIIDSHESLPDPVNAIEKIIINANQKPSLLVRLFNNLQEKGFKLRGDKELVEEFPEYLESVSPLEWKTPYLDKILTFKKVDSLEEAIDWINHYSSSHADCLITESYEESRQFALGVDSALVYINCSPRFRRLPQGGESVFLGMSNQKGQRRGLISLESFTTLKQIVQGDGS